MRKMQTFKVKSKSLAAAGEKTPPAPSPKMDTSKLKSLAAAGARTPPAASRKPGNIQVFLLPATNRNPCRKPPAGSRQETEEK
jgi:hypothetical protein